MFCIYWMSLKVYISSMMFFHNQPFFHIYLWEEYSCTWMWPLCNVLFKLDTLYEIYKMSTVISLLLYAPVSIPCSLQRDLFHCCVFFWFYEISVYLKLCYIISWCNKLTLYQSLQLWWKKKILVFQRNHIKSESVY